MSGTLRLPRSSADSVSPGPVFPPFGPGFFVDLQLAVDFFTPHYNKTPVCGESPPPVATPIEARPGGLHFFSATKVAMHSARPTFARVPLQPPASHLPP